MNKRRRTNEVGETDSETILNILDKNPHVYRSIQAYAYINNNPFLLDDEIMYDEGLILDYVKFFDYIFNQKIFYI
uniref:Uncharacterized protein n=1 Tax=viral metagenome TaxID=1070528 RepID=A0A6C0AEG6_9ZZZZ